MIRNILINIWVIVCPKYWIRNYKTDYELNRGMKRELESPVFSNLEDYSIDLNGITLWISNYPYAFGAIMGADGGFFNEILTNTARLPSRSTQLKLKIAIQNYADTL